MVHIGSIIKDYCRRNGVSLGTVARQMHFTPAGIYKMLAREDIPVTRVKQMSDALGHNFFVYFIENAGGAEVDAVRLAAEVRELNAKVAALQKEVDYLKEINGLLKGRIGELRN
jgi:hypothetical protein